MVSYLYMACALIVLYIVHKVMHAVSKALWRTAAFLTRLGVTVAVTLVLANYFGFELFDLGLPQLLGVAAKAQTDDFAASTLLTAGGELRLLWTTPLLTRRLCDNGDGSGGCVVAVDTMNRHFARAVVDAFREHSDVADGDGGAAVLRQLRSRAARDAFVRWQRSDEQDNNNNAPDAALAALRSTPAHLLVSGTVDAAVADYLQMVRAKTTTTTKTVDDNAPRNLKMWTRLLSARAHTHVRSEYDAGAAVAGLYFAQTPHALSAAGGGSDGSDNGGDGDGAGGVATAVDAAVLVVDFHDPRAGASGGLPPFHAPQSVVVRAGDLFVFPSWLKYTLRMSDEDNDEVDVQALRGDARAQQPATATARIGTADVAVVVEFAVEGSPKETSDDNVIFNID
jgi:hypothetical protein